LSYDSGETNEGVVRAIQALGKYLGHVVVLWSAVPEWE
jgi:hypothetical protein